MEWWSFGIMESKLTGVKEFSTTPSLQNSKTPSLPFYLF